MRSFKQLTGMAAAIALLAVTTAAQAAPAQGPAAKLSLSARASTAGKNKSNAHGSTILVGVLATAAIIGGAIALSSKSNKPKSP